MAIKAPRGTKDLYGKEIFVWHEIEKVIREVCRTHGVTEVRTPIFEQTELFVKGSGETTDVVQKEMYTFKDKSDRSLTLKPEGTPGTVRAYIEHNMRDEAKPVKLYYVSPFFRYEKPQAGRYRQFHQFGVEFFGSYNPALEAEVISVAYGVLESLKIKNVTLHINSLGCINCRKKYNDELKNFISDNIDSLCSLCSERFEKNPLRVLDCKNEKCQEVLKTAPSVLDCLNESCTEDFLFLQKILTEMKIPYVVDPKVVRGLDYYTQTVFEFVCDDLGAKSVICGGGRYDTLVKNSGGEEVGACGFGMGIERLAISMENQNLTGEYKLSKDIYIGAMGEKGVLKSFSIVGELRKSGFVAETDTVSRSVKAQLKYADKINAKYTVIIGDNELECNTVKIKDMETGEQESIEIDAIQQFLYDKLRKDMV